MAGATELFRLSARLVLDTDGFDSGIASAKKQVQGMSGAFAGAESNVTKLSSAMNVAKGIAGVAGQALKKGFDVGKELVGTAASIKALDESMAVTFEGIEDRAAAAFKAVSEENNIVERRLQESGLAFFRQFSGAGMSSANAMKNMENALQLAADAAAAYDISLEDASSMIRSFVRGNVEAGESIGVFVNEQKRNALALEEYGKKWEKLNEAERQFLLLDLVEQTYKQNKVLGQGSREAENYSNVVGNLAKVWETAMGKMGEKALPPVTESLQKLTDWISINSHVFVTIGSGFGWIAEQAAAATDAVLNFTSGLVDAYDKGGAEGVIDTIVGQEGYTSNVVDKWTAFRDMTNGQNGSYAIGEILDAGADAVLSLIGQELEIEAAKLQEPSKYDRQVLFDQYGNRRSFKPSTLFYTSPEDLVDTSALPDVISSAAYKPVVEVETKPEDTAEAKMQRVLDAWRLVVNVHGRWAGWNAGGPGLADAVYFDDNSGGVGQFASGLYRVPYDKFPAWLDRDESVLNRVEAEDWRAAKRGEGMGTNTGITRDELLSTLRNMSISMDGRTVGALVTPYVSREQAAEAWRRR